MTFNSASWKLILMYKRKMDSTVVKGRREESRGGGSGGEGQEVGNLLHGPIKTRLLWLCKRREIKMCIASLISVN